MIEIAETCGFCAGAENAFNATLKAIQDNPGKRVVLFKELLHNQDVVGILETNGVFPPIHNKEEFKSGDIIIIRAHGEPKETIKYFDDHGFKYIDCTCPKVKRIHTLIEKKYNEGYKIFILAEKKTHPEVIGSYSRCNNEGNIIATNDDIEAINNITNEKIFVIAQTTLARENFNKLSEKVKNKFSLFQIEIEDSLCDLQEKIQSTSVDLAKQCRTMIVIGSKDSANTKELYRKCMEVCSDTRWIETKEHFYDKIIKGQFDFHSKIGITGGASVPTKIIKECQQLLMFREFYEEARKKIAERICTYNQLLLQSNNPFFQDAVQQFAAIGESEKAKFIRGSLILLGYKMAQDHNEDYSLDLAAAYELFETSILVHDDVFDKADTRRDVTTVHKKIKDKYLPMRKNKKELIQFTSQSIAICTGDLGFYFVNQIILNAYKNDKNLVSVLGYFNDVVMQTIKGELLDIVLPLEEQLRIPHGKNVEDCVIEIDKTKTAEYTTIGPFCLGLILGGVDRSDLEIYKKLLEHLGVAFQIHDDYLNIFGKPEQGKPLGNDISEYKMTLLYSEICKNEKFKKQLLKYYGKEKLSVKDLEAVRAIFEKSGVKARVDEIKKGYFVKCRAVLDRISCKREEDKDILSGFISYLELRTR